MMRLLSSCCLLLALSFGAEPAMAADTRLEDWVARTVADLPDVGEPLRYHIASDPLLRAVLVWDAGQLIFPEPREMGFPGDTALTVLAAQLRDHRADWWDTPRRDPLDPDRAIYCARDREVCLLLDSAALKQVFPSSLDPERPFAPMVWGGLALTIMLGGLWLSNRRRQVFVQADGPPPSAPTGEMLHLGTVRIHPARQLAETDDGEVALTARDVAILRCLLTRAGEVVSKDDIYDAGWGRDYMPNSRALDQHMRMLRKKLGDATLIETVHGQGYRVQGVLPA